jgi:hypothetical protein
LYFTTFLSIIVALKGDSVTPKKKNFSLKRACCGEEEEEYCCCWFCCGAQNISVTNKGEEIYVKIRISI